MTGALILGSDPDSCFSDPSSWPPQYRRPTRTGPHPGLPLGLDTNKHCAPLGWHGPDSSRPPFSLTHLQPGRAGINGGGRGAARAARTARGCATARDRSGGATPPSLAPPGGAGRARCAIPLSPGEMGAVSDSRG